MPKLTSPSYIQRDFLNTWAKSPFLLGALIVAMTLLAYLPATHCGYIWDDDVYVTENELLSAPDGLERIWFSLDSPSQYFPLVYTTFRTEYALWGLNPAGYHWVNILLHAANSLLVWRLLVRLKVPGAWLAGMIFALHPVQVESVAWITERKNVLMLLFFLLSLLAWTDFIEDHAKRHWKIYALALVCHALALFSKTTACTLPFALLLILWLRRKPVDLRRLLQVAPFFALSIGMGLLTIWWERYHQGTHGKFFALGLAERLIVASHAVWFYAGKLLWPVKLSFSYPLWTLHPWNPLAYGWLLALLALCWAIYCAREDVGRSAEVAALYFVTTLGPILGFIMLYTFRYSYVADHYQYAACIGPIALVSAGLATAAQSLKRIRIPIHAGTAIILLALGLQTWRQCHVYLNGETIWRDTLTLAKNPASFMAHFNLANHLMRQGKYTESLGHYNRAVEIDPAFQGARCNRADNLIFLGKKEEGIADYTAAVKLDPDNALAHYSFAEALRKMNRTDEAIPHFHQAVKIDPHYTLAQKHLGDALVSRGRFAEAIPAYEEIARQLPKAPQSHLLLAQTLSATGKNDGALREYRVALHLDPNSPETLTKVAWQLATSPDPHLRSGTEAVQLAEHACDLTSRKNAEPLSTLAAAYAAAGRFSDAVAANLDAQEIARSSGQKELYAALQKQMESYQAGHALGAE